MHSLSLYSSCVCTQFWSPNLRVLSPSAGEREKGGCCGDGRHPDARESDTERRGGTLQRHHWRAAFWLLATIHPQGVCSWGLDFQIEFGLDQA